MLYVAAFIVGLLSGLPFGAVLMLLRSRGAADRQRADLEARAVAAETRAEQLTGLLAAAQKTADGLGDQLGAERIARTQADTRLEESARNLADQRKLLDDAQVQLVNVFRSLSGEALKSSNEQFLKLAQATLSGYLEHARGDLGKREEAIKSLVSPLALSLTNFDQQVRQMELQRASAYSGLKQYLDTVSGSQKELQAETHKLVAALSQPKTRGNWGELQLKRVVEVAGMSDHCDFTEQVTVESDEGRQRPDMIVHLPAGRRIVVDAKAPMTAYLAALAADSEEARQAALASHARQIRQHMTQLGSKRYFEQFDSTPEMVVLFIPGESFFSAALDCDHTLIEDGAAQRVVLASPTTLIALLRAVSYGWQQEAVAKNAEQISALGKQLYERIQKWAEHLAGVQKSLGQTVDRFNQAMNSLESRVLVTARKFPELGVPAADEVPTLEPVDQTPRDLPADLANGAAAQDLPSAAAPPALPQT